MKTKILVVVDYQNDFVRPDGALPVPDADKIWQNIQKRIDSDEYDSVIYTFDTHTSEQYNDSDEQKIFPNIHCEFGTDGWDFYKIKPRNAKLFSVVMNSSDVEFNSFSINKEYFFTKNEFDIWSGNKEYPEWFEKNFSVEDTEIDVVGVATNYCVFMNVRGMVSRGYKVNVISDAIEGIKAFPDGSVDPSFEENITVMKNNSVKFV